MTTTAHEDQFTAAPEPVREPMSREAILRRSVADLELALKQQTERAEAAEAELAKLAQQKPVVMLNLSHDGSDFEMFYDLSDLKFNSMRMPLYAAPVPAPHKGATHCDDCGLTWLDDGLNPLGCPYCKDSAPAPAEWRRVIDAALGLLESTTCETGVCMCGDSVIDHADFSVGHSACDSGTYHQLGVIEQLRALLQSADRLLEGVE